MKIKMENKTRYIQPDITIISLDNEISLALESSATEPFPGPGESALNSQKDNAKNDPYKIES